MLRDEKLFTDPSTLQYKELQNCAWKIQNKQKATMKLDIVVLQTKTSLFGDNMFSSRTLRFCSEKPLTDWPFTLQNTTVLRSPYSTICCVPTIYNLCTAHANNSLMHMCIHFLMSWEGLSMRRSQQWSLATKVHSTYYTLVLLVSPQCDLTTPKLQVLRFKVQTWLPVWALQLNTPKPIVSLLVCQSVVMTKETTAITC